MSSIVIPMTAAVPSCFGMPAGHHAFVAPKAACGTWTKATLVAPMSDRARKSLLTQGEVAFHYGADRNGTNGTTTRTGQGTNTWSPPTV